MTVPSYTSGLLFTKAHKLVRGRIYELLEGYGLNPTTWAILGATVQAGDGIRLSAVAAILSVKPPLVTLLADQLIDAGLIRRIPHHSDGRAKLLVATPEGKKIASEVETLLNDTMLAMLDGLNPAEIAIFQKTLETIVKNVE